MHKKTQPTSSPQPAVKGSVAQRRKAGSMQLGHRVEKSGVRVDKTFRFCEGLRSDSANMVLACSRRSISQNQMNLIRGSLKPRKVEGSSERDMCVYSVGRPSNKEKCLGNPSKKKSGMNMYGASTMYWLSSRVHPSISITWANALFRVGP